jgi:glycerol-3-phosphate dehydrogenase
MNTTAPAPLPIEREQLLARLRERATWDAVVVGGGATGLGIALDAATRGLKVALIDAQDFAAGTSSRSTKLVHGGVRYLAQGNLKLVREALEERAILLRIAPHIVHPLEFIVPCYRLLEREYMRIGLGMYDLAAGRFSIGPTRALSAAETQARLPGVKVEGLRGGVSYWDGQFDDALMCIALMQTAYAHGATPINYVRCTSLRADGSTAVVGAQDVETGERLELRARSVFNAAGVWVDEIRKLADPAARPVTTVSQGSHIVIDRDFLPGTAGLMIPRTRDGRVLFAIPWHHKLLIGTTDQPRPDAPFDPQPSMQEIDFIIETAAGYLARPIAHADVRAAFAGLRPLFNPSAAGSTAKISREHAVLTEFGNVISVVGGKWTTYRRMAVDALDAAARAGLLPAGNSKTAGVVLMHDAVLIAAADAEPGTDAALQRFAAHCRRFTLARTNADVLARRVRLEFLDAEASRRSATRLQDAAAEAH